MRGRPPAATAGPRGADRARDRGFHEYVLDQLGRLRDLESRAMFGGHGLYQAGVFFGIVHGGRLYFRAGDATRANYEAHGAKPFRPGPRQTLRSYWEVPAEVLEDASEAARWARRAVAEGPAGQRRARK